MSSFTNNENRHEPAVRGPAAANKGKGNKQVPSSILKPRRQEASAPSSSKISGNVIKPAAGVASGATATQHGKPSAASKNTIPPSNNGAAAAAAAGSSSAASASSADKKESRWTFYNNKEEEDGAGKKTTENWESAQKEMDQMFKEQARDKLRDIPEIEIPKELKAVELFPYQRDGLRWMHFQETRSEEEAIPPFYIRKPNGKWRCTLTMNRVQDEKPPAVRGGILADDMGLGKTVQTIALILANPAASFRSRAKAVRDIPRCTLIVCPVSVMANWTTSIKKFVNGQRKVLKVECYHGDSREEMLELLSENKLDVLVTSYNTLASDYKKYQEHLEKNNQDDEEEDLVEKMVAVKLVEQEEKQDDEVEVVENASSSHRPRRATRKNYAEDLSVGSESGNESGFESDDHGSDDDDDESLDDFVDEESAGEWDEDNDEDSLEEPMFIFEHSFHRIVLDEAQQIRNSKTDFNKAVMVIDAKHKWALTGTPFVNKPADIFSLLQFLGVQPFDDEAKFDQYVTQPIMNMRAVGLTRLRVATSFCAFRRTKDHVKKAVKLPNKVVNQVLVDFGEGVHATNHNMFYDTLRAVLHKLLDFNTPSEEKKGGIRLLFTMLIRIKQSCCHTELVPQVVRDQAVLAYQLRDSMESPMKLLDMMKTPDDVDKKAMKFGPDFDARSPKIVALLEQISMMGHDEKGVIFSQFTSYLDIIEKALLSANHTFTRIDGNMNWKQREDAMVKFSSEACDSFETPRFILCSLLACGTGITLTRGNHVFMMDPWWNSSVEMQAYDRVHRVGQIREVHVVRFLMKDSIEERMVAVQEAKQALGKGSLEKMSKLDKEKAKMTTLKDLFEIEEENNNAWDWMVDESDDEKDDYNVEELGSDEESGSSSDEESGSDDK